MYRNILLIIAILLWSFSSQISNLIYSGNTPQDIDNFWDFKKVLYSLVILIILSITYKTYNKVIFIIFCTILLEDIVDRLFFNVKVFEWNDLMSIEIAILITIITLNKNVLLNKIYNFRFFRHDRDKTV